MERQHIHNAIERLGNLLRNEFRRTGASYGLQPVQLEALHYLSISNRYSDTPMAVTEYLGQTKGTVSQSLKVLEKKDYISKKTDENDRRITHLKVTPAGQLLLTQIVPAPIFSRACEHMDDALQNEITESLKALISAVQHANGMKSFGVCRSCRYNQNNGGDSYFCRLTQEALSADDVQLICKEHQHPVPV